MTAVVQSRIGTYRPRIVWGTGTATSTEAYDDVRQYYLNQPGLQVTGIGRDQARAYAPPSAPAFDLTLTNETGRFSPGGPLANFLGRGAAVTLDVDYGVDFLGDDPIVLGDDRKVLGDGYATHRMFTGTARDMPQQISRGQRTVAVTALGRLHSLTTTFPTTILYEHIRTSEAITVLLDAVGWPTGTGRQIDLGDTIIEYWWLNGDTSAMAALNALLDAEGAGGCAWEDGNGTFHFEGRQFRDNNPRSLQPQWAFFDGPSSSDKIGDAPDVLGDDPIILGDGGVDTALMHIIPAEYLSNPDEVVSSVSVAINTRVATNVMRVWEYGGPLVLGPSEVIDIEVAASDPFKNAITPRLDTDYTLLGGGALTGCQLLTTSGQTVTLRLTAPPAGCTVFGVISNGIQVRAVSLPVGSVQTVTSSVDTTLSTARSGAPKEPLVLACWPELERSRARDLVDSMALRYQRERRQITFRVANIDPIHLYAIFDVRPSDRVHFIHTHAALNLELWVETISYLVAPGGGLITATFGCEQVFDLSGGKFDFAQFGDDSTTYDVFGI